MTNRRRLSVDRTGSDVRCSATGATSVQVVLQALADARTSPRVAPVSGAGRSLAQPPTRPVQAAYLARSFRSTRTSGVFRWYLNPHEAGAETAAARPSTGRDG